MIFRIASGKTKAPFHAFVGAGRSPPLCYWTEQTRNNLKTEFRVRAMAAVPSSGSNPYQAPAEAIDFAEVVEDETNSKSPPRPRTVEALRETRPWVSLFGWLGLLASGFMLLASGIGIVSVLFGAVDGESLLWLIVNFALAPPTVRPQSCCSAMPAALAICWFQATAIISTPPLRRRSRFGASPE